MEGAPHDFYKINCDGAFLPESSKGGWGFVIRDHLGRCSGRSRAAELLLNAQHAETLASLKALEQAATLGMQRLILETDAINVVNGLAGTSFDRSPLGMMYKEIRANCYMISQYVKLSIAQGHVIL